MALELMRRPWAGTSLARDLAREFVPLREMMDRLFESAFTPSFWADTWTGSFAMDVYEDDNAYYVHCLLPGIDPNQVSISAQDNVLTIRGERQRTVPEGARPVFQEIGYGTFQKQVALPAPVDADKAEASYHDGILSITLPKAEAVRPKTIKVKAGAAKK
jgi:HSP20 family protein